LHLQHHPAVTRSIYIASAFGGKVHLVHVVADNRNAVDDLARAEQEFDQLKGLYPEISGLEQIIGTNASAIHATPAGTEADLIVIGSHVHGLLRKLAGVNADKILHSAEHDVLAVKSDLYPDNPPPPYCRILVALDLKQGSLAVCSRAANLANALGAELSIVHVVEHFPVDRETTDIAPEDRDPLEYQKEIKSQRAQQIAEQICINDAAVEILISEGSAAIPIVEHARMIAADLIVTGTGTHRLLGMLFESKTDGIVHHAPCDVLVVKGE
jgi:universal stress protein A